jgi:hypothetical protein
MTSGPERICRVALLLLLAVLTGCGTKEVVVEGTFPKPLLEPLPVSLGVWYPAEFSGHEFFDEAKGRAESDWIVRTGEAQVQMWDQLLAACSRALSTWTGEPSPTQMNPAVDAVLIPRVQELQYAIPAHTNVKVYEIWMRYGFELVTVNGEPIADWTMTAYGKTPTAFLQLRRGRGQPGGVVALRDAGAHFRDQLSARYRKSRTGWLASSWTALSPARRPRPCERQRIHSERTVAATRGAGGAAAGPARRLRDLHRRRDGLQRTHRGHRRCDGGHPGSPPRGDYETEFDFIECIADHITSRGTRASRSSTSSSSSTACTPGSSRARRRCDRRTSTA